MDKLNKFYFLLLFVHAIHLVEEVLGNAYFVESVYSGLRNFLIINVALLIIPAVLFYFVSKRQKIALYLAFAYPSIMILDGLDHVVEFFLRNAYFGGAAGLFTGLLFLPLSILLILSLKQALPKKRK
ncbi:HXXEE domain-containing protein [Candidatus Woesearchaeota archaeon]|nr:HXXEE domain-containing protein [Candidatus Woesearchaeota archaeon]